MFTKRIELWFNMCMENIVEKLMEMRETLGEGYTNAMSTFEYYGLSFTCLAVEGMEKEFLAGVIKNAKRCQDLADHFQKEYKTKSHKRTIEFVSRIMINEEFGFHKDMK